MNSDSTAGKQSSFSLHRVTGTITSAGERFGKTPEQIYRRTLESSQERLLESLGFASGLTREEFLRSLGSRESRDWTEVFRSRQSQVPPHLAVELGSDEEFSPGKLARVWPGRVRITWGPEPASRTGELAFTVASTELG